MSFEKVRRENVRNRTEIVPCISQSEPTYPAYSSLISRSLRMMKGKFEDDDDDDGIDLNDMEKFLPGLTVS